MEFTKIQGTGNDFIIIDNTKIGLSESKLSILASRVCKRKYSIGADGFIAIEHSNSNADFRMNFYNSDGSMAEMCGNGARCVARYAYENKIAGERMLIETVSGNIYAWRIDKRTYKVKLNNPTLIYLENKINIDDTEFDYSYIELGNPGLPHVVIKYKGLNNTDNCDILELARKIRENKRFVKGSNVSFYDIISATSIKIEDGYLEDSVHQDHDIIDNSVVIRTYERGVENFTLACGTAAGAAAAVISLKKELPQNNIKLISDGGELTVEIDKSDKNIIENIYLIGDTNIVATGKITDEDLRS